MQEETILLFTILTLGKTLGAKFSKTKDVPLFIWQDAWIRSNCERDHTLIMAVAIREDAIITNPRHFSSENSNNSYDGHKHH